MWQGAQRWWRDHALQVQPAFLPNFCETRVAFVVILTAQLLAIVLTLAAAEQRDFWIRLGLHSLFVQWVAVSCAALLCKLRPWLARRPLAMAASLSYLLILCVTALFSWMGGPLIGSDADLLRHLAIAGIIGAVLLRYFYLQQEYRNRVRAAAEARVAALQARIHPHFLFNSMNAIASLTRSDPVRAEQAIEDLSELFRASLGVRDAQVPLAEELDLCKRYLDIEQLRLGARLQVQWQIDDGLDAALLPLLSVQPLVENAVYHGIQPAPKGGTVGIRVMRDADLLCVRIENPLPPAGPAHRRTGHGVALDNVRERLRMLFGERASVTAEAGETQFVSELRVPFQAAGKNSE